MASKYEKLAGVLLGNCLTSSDNILVEQGNEVLRVPVPIAAEKFGATVDLTDDVTEQVYKNKENIATLDTTMDTKANSEDLTAEVTRAKAAEKTNTDKTTQLTAEVGDLTKLKTTDKTSLVNAVNEVKQSGGGGGSTTTDKVTDTDSGKTQKEINTETSEHLTELSLTANENKTFVKCYTYSEGNSATITEDNEIVDVKTFYQEQEVECAVTISGKTATVDWTPADGYTALLPIVVMVTTSVGEYNLLGDESGNVLSDDNENLINL